MRLLLPSAVTSVAVATLLGCGSAPANGNPQDAFWRAIDALCGQAFGGTVVAAPADDTTFANQKLVMHVRTCQQSELRIPFHVSGDRSRTWILSRTDSGLRLKHDHRHVDGSEDLISQYGGDTNGAGEPGKQEFLADSITAAMIPAAATNVWTIEIEPGRRFVYALRRGSTDQRFRIEFDLTKPLPLPPSPWASPSP